MASTTAAPAGKTRKPILIKNLRRFNIIAGFAHLLQMVLILVLANDFSLPITASYLQGPPGPNAQLGSDVLLNSRIAYGVALFFALSALFHFIVASPGFFPRYERGLLANHNYFRWVEYSISSSVMIVLIAQICGVQDVIALMAIFGVNASMILFGWLQEKYETPGSGGFVPFIFGCMTGIVPWLAIIVVTIVAAQKSPQPIPPFVIGIIVSLFVFFNSFALVQWLQYKKIGRWADYLRGERAYIVLSLVAKSALAWQIFGGTLAPTG